MVKNVECPTPWKAYYRDAEFAATEIPRRERMDNLHYETRFCVCGYWHLYAQELDHWGLK